MCFGERSWIAGVDDPEFWNPEERAPNCFGAPAAHSVLPQYVKRAEWVIAGDSRADRQGYLSDQAASQWVPHIMMFFVASGQAGVWAAGLDSRQSSARTAAHLNRQCCWFPCASGRTARPIRHLAHITEMTWRSRG